MKKLILSLFLILPWFASAQLTETFDSNSWGWSEYSDDDKGEAIIINGVLHLESKRESVDRTNDILNGICSMAYAPIDVQKGFRLSCEALIDKVDYDKTFGLVLDYRDDWNCILLLIRRDNAYYYRIHEGKVVSYLHRQFKLGKQKKAALDINLKYIDGNLELRVNDISAFNGEIRNVKIDSNGIGFFAFGKVKVDFDNVTVSDLF